MVIQDERMRKKLMEIAQDFRLPRYDEIPDVGLYLDQVVRYVNRYYPLCEDYEITSSMVSNYVKHKIIPGPHKKSYGANSIARLIVVGYLKLVSPLDDIRMMEDIQNETYDVEVAYNYFCGEMENIISYIFGLKDMPEIVGKDNTLEKELLRSAVLAVAHKLYLDNYFRILRECGDTDGE